LVAAAICARSAHGPTERGIEMHALEEEGGSLVAVAICARSAHDPTERGVGTHALEEEGGS
jgi:hypothetical protein